MKGQVWSIDFAASTMIFLVIIIVVFFSWSYITQQSYEKETLSEIQQKAIDVSDILIRTHGLPDNWNSTNARSIGLASAENILNETKVLDFLSMDYGMSKAILGTKNDYYFSVNYLNGSTVVYNGTVMEKGTYPINSDLVVPIQRLVLFDSKICRMNLILYA